VADLASSGQAPIGLIVLAAPLRWRDVSSCIAGTAAHGRFSERGEIIVMPCKFCYRDEPRCDSENLILCSRCFQIAANSTQEQIRRAYDLAIAKGQPGKADALKKFIIGEFDNEREPNNTKRQPRHIAEYSDRTGDFKNHRLKKIAISRLPGNEGATIPQNQQKLPAVP
jgi:hypothetical protein